MELELVKAFAQSYPGWQGELLTDSTLAAVGSSGLFPVGRELLQKKEDVLGNVRSFYRQKFLLRRRDIRGEKAAAWLLEFARWAEAQTPPPLGENPKVLCREGKLYAALPDGTAIYQVELIMEYEKENEYGKN